jgi:hypothetical protein
MESITVGAASEPSEEQALAALEEAAATAPSTTEEALAQQAEASSAAKLPEKFKSTADLLKAYEELERKLGTQTSEEDEGEEEVADENLAEKSDEEVTEEDLPDDLEISEEDVEEAAEDDDTPLTATEVVDYLTERFSAQDGQLSEVDYQMAEDLGYDRNMVDAYIRGQQAQAELADFKISEAAGGKDNLEAMLIWAATGLTASEIETYNTALADNDVTKATLGVAKLRERYEAYNGREPKLLGGKPPRADISGFTSWSEVTVAMKDPRYGKDAAYTQTVANKLDRSSI